METAKDILVTSVGGAYLLFWVWFLVTRELEWLFYFVGTAVLAITRPGNPGIAYEKKVDPLKKFLGIISLLHIPAAAIAYLLGSGEWFWMFSYFLIAGFWIGMYVLEPQPGRIDPIVNRR